ncbi:MAG TPA: ferritin-like domain-containing protein [Stellaceae bacterium]|nr:ferritin-like domain-containing protein [Stellaceae bacterium]
MGRWTLDDIPWDLFDRNKLDPDIVRIVKAASLVEYNGGAYAHHLCRIFHDDPDFQQNARRWGEEEIQHGKALARWAAMSDPEFDFEAAFQRFQAGYQVDFDLDVSRRGSRAGEMVARCMVEVGTSSYYSALRDAVQEPVLKEICRNIAADEIRHYKLFYNNLLRCLEREPIGLWGRLRVALGRIAESEDDELAYAYYAANEQARPYERRRCSRAYAHRAFTVCRRHHVAHGVSLIFKAVGLNPHGRLVQAATSLAWNRIRHQAAIEDFNTEARRGRRIN